MAAYPILEITNAPKVLKNNGSVTSRAQKFLCFTLVGHMRCYVYFCSALILLCALGPNVSILLSHKMAFVPNTETLTNFPKNPELHKKQQNLEPICSPRGNRDYHAVAAPAVLMYTNLL